MFGLNCQLKDFNGFSFYPFTQKLMRGNKVVAIGENGSIPPVIYPRSTFLSAGVLCTPDLFSLVERKVPGVFETLYYILYYILASWNNTGFQSLVVIFRSRTKHHDDTSADMCLLSIHFNQGSNQSNNKLLSKL